MSAQRTFVVGDVHGCSDELDALLEQVGFCPGDRLVFVGDLVAKGPDSAGVVARARTLGALGVLGNHELPLLALDAARRADRAPPKVRATHREAFAAMGGADLAWLAALPYSLALPEHGVVVVHAGVAPGIPISAQDPEQLVNMRSIRGDGTPSKRIEDGAPWASVYAGPEHIVFGHDAIRGLQRHPLATGLDTGCVYGGKLSALELPGFALHQVDARKAYAPL